jgi:iron-sulfur cluster repair protein YtfE (RIC family)
MHPLHELFVADHARLRRQITDFQTALKSRSDQVETLYPELQKAVRAHFRKEDDVYYPHIDSDKKVLDRELMHTLRNDHAAVVFALESLAIRLRRKVPLEEWTAKFDTMISVLLPHFDQEEKKLFPEVERAFSPAVFQTLLEKIQALE